MLFRSPSDHACFQDSQCGLQGFWGDVGRAIDRVLRETTIANLAARHERAARPVFSASDLTSRLT